MMYQNVKDRMTEKLLRKIITFLVVAVFALPHISPAVFAATPITIIGGDDVMGGDTFTVAVTFGNGAVGRVDAQMIYDTDKLTYVSGGSSTGNTGYIQLKNAGTEGSITFNIEFQALTEGEATLEVTTNEMYDLDEMYLDTPSAMKTIVVSGDAEEEELITETTSPEEPAENTSVMGIDEKPEEEAEEEGYSNISLIFIFAAVVLVILIVVIAVLLAARKKGNIKSERRSEEMIYDAGRRDTVSQMPRVGRSGMILDDDSRYDGGTNLRSEYDREEYDRIEQETIKKRAREETAVWGDWDLGDNTSDDIEKW